MNYGKKSPQLWAAIENEEQRQQDTIELIASENIVSDAVREAQGSVLTNKYAEGYPNKRYYGGCEFIDQVEQLAINYAKKLFNAAYVNVQPHSGSQANMAVYQALLKPGDVILGMGMDAGGHLTHGATVNFSGKLYKTYGYGLNPDTEELDYDEIMALAKKVKPQLIVAGASAYSRIIDWQAFRKIADEVGAYLMVDMAHIAGLVATGAHPSPLPIADVVTTTTHKTLRGPRGGVLSVQTHQTLKYRSFLSYLRCCISPVVPYLFKTQCRTYGSAELRVFGNVEPYVVEFCHGGENIATLGQKGQVADEDVVADACANA